MGSKMLLTCMAIVLAGSVVGGGFLLLNGDKLDAIFVALLGVILSNLVTAVEDETNLEGGEK